MDEPIESVIARSSLGGYAWCFHCHHPAELHAQGPCIVDLPCVCPGLQRMTPDEWLAWRYPAGRDT